jgi:hypothetical protein
LHCLTRVYHNIVHDLSHLGLVEFGLIEDLRVLSNSGTIFESAQRVIGGVTYQSVQRTGSFYGFASLGEGEELRVSSRACCADFRPPAVSRGAFPRAGFRAFRG